MKKQPQPHAVRKPLLLSMLFATVLILSLIFMSIPVRAEEAETVSPGNCRVSAEDTYAVFSWDNPGYDDCYYRVQADKNQNWDSPEYDFEQWETFCEFYGLARGEKYSFRVQTVRDIEFTDEYGYVQSSTVCSSWSQPVTILIAYSAPELTSVKSSGANSITLKWNTVSGADTYRIYRSTASDGSYTAVKTLTDSNFEGSLSFKDTGVKAGTKYYYKVCTFNEGFTYTDGYLSQILSATPVPTKRTLTAKTAGYSSIKLSWKKGETGVSGYAIYRSGSENGTYKRIKTIEDRDTTSWKDTKLTTGKAYYYKIKAYAANNDKNHYGSASSAVKGVPAVLAPKIESAKITAVTKAEITWSKVSGAHGYAVYRASSKNGTYKRIATINSSKTLSCTATGLTNGETYYFKVKAYRTVGDKNYYGSASAAKSRLMNKLGYAGESYESKCKRIFKTDYYKEYKTSKEASADMTKISVKVWDIDSSGKKYTRTMTLSVHKNIASTVKQIFKEIYNGSEKFPIHSVSGYSWRGDSSSSEHCEGLAIDINPDENAMIRKSDGKVLAGKFYKPGKNPYSIPADGDVVKAFEKYGFSWGDWSTKRDYMHFSYFGT